MTQNRLDAYVKSVIKLGLVKRIQKMLQTIKKYQLRFYSIIAIFVFVLAIGAIYVSPTKTTQAESLTELRARAAELQAKIDQTNAAATDLAAQGETLKAKIAEFDGQIAAADTQISLINNKLSQLEIELVNAQTELDRQKELLRASVVALYKKGGASTVELLVGSDSFTTFFNEQTYLERLKTGVQESTEKVIALKQQIQTQKDEQKSLLKKQEEVRASIASTRQERSNLLAQTQGEESKYRAISEELKAQQTQLLAEIVSRSTVVVSSYSGGGYPDKWANAPLDAYVDDWGMYSRECVSYAAFKVASSGRHMPYWGGRGNANQWPANARAAGIPTGSQPKVGAIAVWNFGYYGHVAHVDAILSDGRVKISEYNVPAWTGNYSERIISANDPYVYIYF